MTKQNVFPSKDTFRIYKKKRAIGALRVPIQVLAVPLLISLPANVLWKAAKALVPYHPNGNLSGLPEF